MRYAVMAVTYAFLGTTAMQVLSLVKLKSYDLESMGGGATLFVDYLTYMLWVYLGVLLAVGVFAFIYSVFWSHQLAGPFVPILRQIDEMTKGNYKGRIRLRKGDELLEIGEALNHLSEVLEKGR